MQNVSSNGNLSGADELSTMAPPAGSHSFRFTATPGGFFAIWIVNLFLSIITLGIYSAWATVRKKRYFYAHTWVANANFEYHGNPIAILKGRLIAVAALGAYYGIGHFIPKLAAAAAVVLFAAAPWLIARSMAFNAYNSSYRNIRFRFQATYKDVLNGIWPGVLVLALAFLIPEWDPGSKQQPPALFWVVVGLQMLTLAAVYPYVVGSLKKLQVNHAQFGTAPFATELGLGAFYKIYVLALLILLGAAIVAGAIGAGLAMLSPMTLPVVLIAAYFAIGSLVLAYTKSRIGNLVFNNARLDRQVSFVSNLKVGKLAWIYMGNLFAILLSLGLAIPWAVVRVMRYRAGCLSLQSAGSLDNFIGGVSASVGATGEELGEFFNIDLSL
jgi:uncharacterized membrane protein YjgN (DUF898 family)